MKRIRESNIELLRIISMLMVLIVHADGASLGIPLIMDISMLSDHSLCSKMLIESFAIIGVNCFVLISGYYGIRASVAGLIKFIAMCMFYAIGTLAICDIIYPNVYDTDDYLTALMIFPNNDLWFVPAYLVLYVVSPALNYIISMLNLRLLAIVTSIIVIINIILGWVCTMEFNAYGYTASQLIMLYFIGRCIAYFRIQYKISTQFSLITYIIVSLLIFVSSFYMFSRTAFAYNSPIVILSSVMFFMIFRAMPTFRNRAINYTASSAFAVYLIHKAPPVWIHFVELINYISSNISSSLLFTAATLATLIIIYFICIAIDRLTFTPLYNTIFRTITHIITKKWD